MSTPPPAPAPAGDIDPADVVLRFLESVGRRSEAQFYLDLFRARPREQFAAIAIDANVMRDAADAVVLDLRFLAPLGLVPIVLLGMFQPADAATHARSLRRRLVRAGVASEVLSAREPDLAARVTELTRTGTVPVVTFDAVEAETPAARFDALGRLLSSLSTRKLIFLQRPGGLRQRGALVPLVNLTTDLPALAASRELSRKEAAMVEQSRRLVLELVAHPLLVAITSPLNLLGELFTVKGAGTLLRRGATIVRHEGWEGVDRERLRALLVSSFGRAPADAFFGRSVARIYLEEAYRGGAVLMATPLGAYLTKFAVSREAQGEGMGRDLWDAVEAENPVVFWRARPTNPIVEWYGKLCDGFVRTSDWNVYWRGVSPTALPEVIAHVLAQPIDMPPAVPEAESANGGETAGPRL